MNVRHNRATDYEFINRDKKLLARFDHDTKIFESMGIYDGKRFKIKELKGEFIVDIVSERAYEADWHSTQKRFIYIYVDGLYQHLLDGTWHKE